MPPFIPSHVTHAGSQFAKGFGEASFGAAEGLVKPVKPLEGTELSPTRKMVGDAVSNASADHASLINKVNINLHHNDIGLSHESAQRLTASIKEHGDTPGVTGFARMRAAEAGIFKDAVASHAKKGEFRASGHAAAGMTLNGLAAAGGHGAAGVQNLIGSSDSAIDAMMHISA